MYGYTIFTIVIMNNVVIAIDDLHPEQGWGCEGDESVEYLEALNEEFGCKFTLFIPSNYHNKYPLSQNRDWVDFWKSKDWVEMAAHGHFHKCTNPNIGEQEFLELNNTQALNRINESFREWTSTGHFPIGFRMPGWGCNQESADAVSSKYRYIAAHDQINKHVKFKTNVLFGCDGIHERERIYMWETGYVFQSHIAGEWNDNCWNESNYTNFQQVLKYLSTDNKLNFKTFSEL